MVFDRIYKHLVFPPHSMHASLIPGRVRYSSSTGQIVLELIVPVKVSIVQWHIKKEDKCGKVIGNININQWMRQVFGIEIQS